MKSRKLIIFLSLSLLPGIIFSSNAYSDWAKTYGGGADDEARSIQQTADGGYIVAGWSSSFGAGNKDFLVLKLSSTGTVQWQKAFGGWNEDFAYSIQKTSDSKYGDGYIVVGKTLSFGAGNYDFLVIKLNSSGGIQWQKTLGGSTWDEAYSVIQASDTSYVVAGTAASFGAGASDVLVAKITIGGGIQWAKAFGWSGYEAAYEIQQTSDGGYILAGYTNSFGGNVVRDILVLKLNSSGGYQWAKTYGASGDDEAYSIQQTTDGGYILGGYSHTIEHTFDYLVLKLSSTGDIVWQKTYGLNEGDDIVYSVRQTSDGGFIVAGIRETGLYAHDYYYIRLSSSGSKQWERIFTAVPGPGVELAYSVQQTSDGGYVIAGAGYWEFFVTKLDSSGSIPGCPRIFDRAEPNPFVNIVTTIRSPAEASLSISMGNPSVTVTAVSVDEGTICSGGGGCGGSSAEASSGYSGDPSSSISMSLYGLLALIMVGLVLAACAGRAKRKYE